MCDCVNQSRVEGGSQGRGRGGVAVERRLLGVGSVDGARSSGSGEVEWLVPANHAATGETHKRANIKMEAQV